ncbi:hypothetical protein CAOG_09069 [Capsaspora owczarzaki ATCC 30864]|uniref:Phospholipase B-like n=1 Tax=Capsaspora owczarzaki (strain ATCC 30864) TaxID=595528 RepID=A0A0D2VZW6_CAPO3|nr:hypothetical protein CAOG_09069 [Capsaspora owczarzaki ATCC 30864]KJE97432.1 hypothetical protein CAOG_009069 [Capsaspora owczarzaki ATCC 30864]|eukprot:XP_011270802.1 hypothetical protein CAOG_09069 [Capsaspora owczarzaki ATCC 30864]
MTRQALGWMALVAVVLAAAAAAATANALPTPNAAQLQATVYIKNGQASLSMGVLDPSGAAYGTFEDGLMTTGWGVFEVKTNSAFKDAEQLYAAGFLEGALTYNRIYDHYQNMFTYFFPNASDPSVQLYRNWFNQQDAWTRRNVQLNPQVSFWVQTGSILAQFDGLVAGYNAVAASSRKLDVFAFQVLNGNGDILDLMNVLQPSTRPSWNDMTPQQAQLEASRRGHCSGFIKMLPGFEDILISHSSWFTFTATNRIYKHYNFQLNDQATAAKRTSFSSYPAYLSSLDDFYIMDSGLVMIQTTNNVFNMSLYDLVRPESLLAWQRVRLANTMAHDGREWSHIVAQFNSGTYNNQYMVVTLDQIKLGQAVLDGALWVVEQIPGYVESADVTPILRAGYFSSFNVPFFERVFDMSGYPAMVAKYGVSFTHDLAPRAEIFRRDSNTVVDFSSLKQLMRSNSYKTDPYSGGSPANAVCSRYDLIANGGSPDGCYDTKATNYARARLLQADALNGPTTANSTLPAYSWSAFANLPHVGLPETYNFDFITVQPAL